MENTVWQHTIRNACQDQVLPHSLFNPITMFNIHHNSHFTSLITNNHAYYYFDSLNLRPPPAINIIHNTLRQWYSGLEISPPLLHKETPLTHIQSTPQQTDGWTCGIHMLRINRIPRPHPYPHTHPTHRGITLTILPQIRYHRGTRHIRN